MKSTTPDPKLFKKCQAGDRLAWELFVRRYQQRIFSLAGAYTRNIEDTRDLAQEIFIKLYRNLGKCRDSDLLIPWMMTLARNTAIDFIRRTRRHPPAYDYRELLDSLDSGSPSPEDFCTQFSRADLLRKAIHSLGILNREIIMLREIQELSINEIAEILNVPTGTVKSRLTRARIELTRAVMALSEVCDVKI